jgi:chromosome partitioning protein
MVIIIGNQKGGAGKSTLTLLFANYLTLSRQKPVTVIDMDYQQSLAQKFERAKVLENVEPYMVAALALDQFTKKKQELKDHPQVLFLIDLPGKLDDDGLIEVFKAADLAICPFSYDEFSFESTVFFSLVLKKIKPAIPIVYVPNRIKANVKYEILKDVDEQLLLLGEVTQAIPDRIDFQRANTFQTPDAVNPLLLPVFDHIYKKHIQQIYERDQNSGGPNAQQN